MRIGALIPVDRPDAKQRDGDSRLVIKDYATTAKIFQAGGNKVESSTTFPIERQLLNLGRRSKFLTAADTSSGVYSLPLKMQDIACVRAIQRQARLPFGNFPE